VRWSARLTRWQGGGLSATAADAGGSWSAPELALDLRLQDPAFTNRQAAFAARELQFSGRFTPPADPPADPPPPDLWSNLPPGRLDWNLRSTRLQTETLGADPRTPPVSGGRHNWTSPISPSAWAAAGWTHVCHTTPSPAG